jgi:Tfp pilus assembly protein PilF
MIALASGRKQDAVKLFQRALELNPKFDPIQAPIAQKKLGETLDQP